ncbi:MAG TPA: AzlC family ABC transporter permease [Chloroflexia bacterium]|nr:AzlC family ABC transporter permease [Chloroflexia bacterium]
MLNRKSNVQPVVEPAESGMSFTLAGALAGAKLSIPVAVGVFTYGLVFGVLAGQSGLSLLEVIMMSGLVFAGASQLTALGLWTAPLPIFIIIFTTLIVNLRHILMGAALRPYFSGLTRLQRYVSFFFLSDESWALTIAQYARGSRNGAFMLGSGVTVLSAWLGSTALGRGLGSIINDPAQWGLDFAFTAVFISLLVGMWKGKPDLIPWLVAAGVAVATYYLIPGKWYILSGGVAGSLVGAWLHAD